VGHLTFFHGALSNKKKCYLFSRCSYPSHIVSRYGTSPADMLEAITQPIELYTFLRQWLFGTVNGVPLMIALLCLFQLSCSVLSRR
jgi:hypothetical protein